MRTHTDDQALAAALNAHPVSETNPGAWSAVMDTRYPDHEIRRIVSAAADFPCLSVTGGYGRSRFRVFAEVTIPHADVTEYANESITLAATATPEAMAAHIVRRLLPKIAERIPPLRERADAANDWERRLLAAVEVLAPVARLDPHNKNRMHPWEQKSPAYGCQLNLNGDRVTFERLTVSASEARRVLECLAPNTAHDVSHVLNPRELATVLAALRLYQETEPAALSNVADIASNDDTLKPLSADEIDALCCELNHY